MRERESLFNEYLIEVRRKEKEEKFQKREAVSGISWFSTHVLYDVCGKILNFVVEGLLKFKLLSFTTIIAYYVIFDVNSFKVIICISGICVILLATR